MKTAWRRYRPVGERRRAGGSNDLQHRTTSLRISSSSHDEPSVTSHVTAPITTNPQHSSKTRTHERSHDRKRKKKKLKTLKHTLTHDEKKKPRSKNGRDSNVVWRVPRDDVPRDRRLQIEIKHRCTLALLSYRFCLLFYIYI